MSADTIQALLAIAGLALITVLARAFFMIPEREIPMPDWLRRGLKYAPLAALTAVIAPEIFMAQGALIGMDVPGLDAGKAFVVDTETMAYPSGLAALPAGDTFLLEFAREVDVEDFDDACFEVRLPGATDAIPETPAAPSPRHSLRYRLGILRRRLMGRPLPD